MLRLHNLTPSGKNKKRIGRGGSRGGTSGKGHKGQKARSGGGIRPGFEGGQMPLYRRLPKRGFTNAAFKTEYAIVNLERLNKAFNDGDEVSIDVLINKGIINIKRSESKKIKKKVLLKVLGSGPLDKKLTIAAHAFSKSAQESIDKAGGKVQLIKES